MKAAPGEISLAANTNYQLRVRFRDDTGAVSGYATADLPHGQASTTFPMEIQDVANSPAPTWTYFSGGAVDLPFGGGMLTPGDAIIAIDWTEAVSRPASNRSERDRPHAGQVSQFWRGQQRLHRHPVGRASIVNGLPNHDSQ